MRGLTMRKITALTILAVLLGVVFVVPGDASASHYTYMQENPEDRQTWSGDYPFNATYIDWSQGSFDALWTDDGSFTQRVRNAIQSWESAVPQLSFASAGTRPYNLYFKKGSCGMWVDACMISLTTLADHSREANYLLTAEIRLTLAQSRLTDLGIEDQLRHEIGHWIVLDDQYNESGSPACSDVVSVMNDSYASTGLNCKSVHAPTPWDIDAVTTYWKGGSLEDPVLKEGQSRHLELEWVDAMWSEDHHRVYLWYWNPNTSRWFLAQNVRFVDGIGFHRDSISRDMEYSWIIGGDDLPTDRWYAVGVRAWNWPEENDEYPIGSSPEFPVVTEYDVAALDGAASRFLLGVGWSAPEGHSRGWRFGHVGVITFSGHRAGVYGVLMLVVPAQLSEASGLFLCGFPLDVRGGYEGPSSSIVLYFALLDGRSGPYHILPVSDLETLPQVGDFAGALSAECEPLSLP